MILSLRYNYRGVMFQKIISFVQTEIVLYWKSNLQAHQVQNKVVYRKLCKNYIYIFCNSKLTDCLPIQFWSYRRTVSEYFLSKFLLIPTIVIVFLSQCCKIHLNESGLGFMFVVRVTIPSINNKSDFFSNILNIE